MHLRLIKFHWQAQWATNHVVKIPTKLFAASLRITNLMVIDERDPALSEHLESKLTFRVRWEFHYLGAC